MWLRSVAFWIFAPCLAFGGSPPEGVDQEAARALRSIATANADFRANDRDGNGINDFWTGDVAGLYRFGQLIPREVAEADAAPIQSLVPKPVPYHGYFFRAMDADESSGKPEEYRQDTDGKNGRVHHNSMFGFCAYPSEYGKTGKSFFIVNEGNTIFRRASKGPPVLRWPKDEDLNSGTNDLEQAPATPLLVVKDAVRELRRTRVTAHLLERHEPGVNLVWCASFQLAWNGLLERAKAPLGVDQEPEMVRALHKNLVTRDHVPHEAVVAKAGSVKDGIVDAIRSEMAGRFPDASLPDFSGARDLVAFAYLRRDLPFAVPLYRNPRTFDFRGNRVASFGLWHGAPGSAKTEQLAEVSVLDFVSPEDFILELHPEKRSDRIIVARMAPGQKLLDTVASTLKRIAGKAGRLTMEDDFLMPCIHFDVTRVYREIIGRPLPGLLDSNVDDARQEIKFKLDEAGARLESTAYLYALLNGGRHVICDGPFLVLLLKDKAEMPYFALWVENSELLVPAGERVGVRARGAGPIPARWVFAALVALCAAALIRIQRRSADPKSEFRNPK